MGTTYSKLTLTGSTDGAPIKLTTTGSPGNLLHTAVSGAGSLDEIWLWGVVTSASTRVVTVQFGGVGSPDNNLPILIQPTLGLFCLIPGLILQNGLVCRAYADAANEVNIVGYVNRITVV